MTAMSESSRKRYTLTTKGAAEYLGIPLRSFEQLVADRQIEHVAVGERLCQRRMPNGLVQVFTRRGRLYFAPEDLDAWVARKRVQVAERHLKPPRERQPIQHAPAPDDVREPLLLPAVRRFA